MTELLTPDAITKNTLLLYADNGYYSHVIRYLLAEKKIDYQIHYIDEERPEDLADLNPYCTLPVFVHANMVLYEINTIFEYLEDRYHHHKLLPIAPQDKAQVRQLAWRIQKDWLSLGYQLLLHPDSFDQQQAKQAHKKLADSFITIAPLFGQKSFFLSDTLGWCDILLVPLLWHLQQRNFSLPAHLVRPLLDYQQRMFERSSFQQSLRIDG